MSRIEELEKIVNGRFEVSSNTRVLAGYNPNDFVSTVFVGRSTYGHILGVGHRNADGSIDERDTVGTLLRISLDDDADAAGWIRNPQLESGETITVPEIYFGISQQGDVTYVRRPLQNGAAPFYEDKPAEDLRKAYDLK